MFVIFVRSELKVGVCSGLKLLPKVRKELDSYTNKEVQADVLTQHTYQS